MSAFVTLFGDTLRSKHGEARTEEVLRGKVAIAVFFTGHWCPPCRHFTPKLVQAYTEALCAKGLEVVFVSSDASEEQYDNYYSEMPWLALPYAKRDLKQQLCQKFGVTGIPNLVILDPEGNLITDNGRGKVMQDPTGEAFPWN